MRTLFIVTCILILVSCHSDRTTSSGLIISPENPNYYEYNGKPTLIISATEHYFALVNSKFDYDIYLNRLHSLGFNMASVMSGVFLEPSGQGEGEALILPWQRSSEEGYNYGGNRFDLSEWNDAYFNRLESFVSTANDKNIIVKYIFFAPIFDNHKWSGTPFNPVNNINSEYAQIQPNDIYTLDRNQGLIDIQKELIDRVTAVLSNFPNVVYEITFNGDHQWNDYDWYRHMHDYLLEQMPEPKKPVVFNMGVVRTPESYDTDLPMETFQGRPVGRTPIPEPFPGAMGISYMYTGYKQLVHIVGNGLPVLHAESPFRPNWEPHVRQHAFQSLLSGAGAYTFVDFVFSVRYPDGYGAANPRPVHGGGAEVQHSMATVSKIMNSVNFINMHPNHSLVSFKNSQFEATVLANEGEEYLAYISPAPASQNYRVVYRGFIKPNTEGWHDVKAQAHSTLRFSLGGNELANLTDYVTANRSVTGRFQYDGINPIPFELESRFQYYENNAIMFLGADSVNNQAITYEQLLATDGVTQGVEASYFTGDKFDEMRIWRIEDRVEHRAVSSPFFNEDLIQRTSFNFALPSGEYRVQWLDTKTGAIINESTIQHAQGEYRFHTPVFIFDIALKIKKI